MPNSFSKFKYNDACNAFHTVRNRTESHITSEIERLCKNDKVDFFRIEGLFNLIMQEETSTQLGGDEVEFHLSAALSFAKFSLKAFDRGELEHAFIWLGLANQFLGEARAPDIPRDDTKSLRLRFDDVVAQLAEADGVIKLKDKVIDKYQQGTKSSAAANKTKWALANKYLKEEIPRHRRINDARAAAAHRAGIGVATRRLIQMMPDPRKA